MPTLKTEFESYVREERASPRTGEADSGLAIPSSPRTGSVMQPPPSLRKKAPSSVHARLPQWAVLASAVWVIVAATYLLTVALAGQRSGWTPGTIGGALAGLSAPLVLIWLIALLKARSLEAEAITAPVRRQLASLLAPGAGAEVRVRRVTELLGAQADQLREAASVALDDSSAAMAALTRQSGELRRLTAEALLEIGRVSKTAEQTVKHLQDAAAQLNTQSGEEREKTLALVTGLERHTRQALEQVDQLADDYEAKLARLDETVGQIENRTRNLATLKSGVDGAIGQVTGLTAGDVARLESVVSELTAKSAAITQQLARPVETLGQAAHTLDQNVRQSHDMIEAITTTLERAGESAITRTSALVATLSDRMSTMELLGAKLVSVGASAQSDTGRYVARLEEAAAGIRAEAEKIDAVSVRALSRSDSVAGTLRTGAETLAQALSASQRTFEDLASGIEDRAARLTEISQDARTRMEDAQLLLESSQDGFAEQLERLGQLSRTLQGSIEAADKGAASLTSASQLAEDRATLLMRSSEATRTVLGSIASALQEQQGSVEGLAASLAVQVEALTSSLQAQQAAVKEATSVAGTEGEQARAALQSQVQAMAEATTGAASRLDALQLHLTDGTGHLRALAERMEGSLSGLVSTIATQAEQVSGATQALQGEQGALGDVASRTQATLASLMEGLGAAQSRSSTLMDGVADRLSSLRAEVERANVALRQSGQEVSTTQGQLGEQTVKLAGNFSALLSRLDLLTGGLESAGQTVAAQGQAAEALMERAEQNLLQVSGRLRDEGRSVHQAVADVSEGLQQQQEQLARLHEAIDRIASSLTQRGAFLRADMAASEEALAGAAGRLDRTAVESRGILDGVVDQVEAAASVLQAETRGSIASLRATTAAFASSSQELHAGVEGSDETICRLRQDVATLQQTLSTLSAHSDVLADSLSRHAGQAEMAGAALEGASRTVDTSAAQLASRMESLSAVAQQQQRVMADMAVAVHLAQEALDDSGQQTQSALQTTLSQLAEAGAEADRVLDRVMDRIRLAGAAAGGEAGSAGTLLTELAATLRATAEDFTRRVEGAQSQLASVRGDLSGVGEEVEAGVGTLRTSLSALRADAGKAHEELVSHSGTVGTVSADVARAAENLVAMIGRLAETGGTGAGKLADISSSILHSLSQVQVVAERADESERRLAEKLVLACEGFSVFETQAGQTQGVVEAVAERMLSRLGDVSSLLLARSEEGEARLAAVSGSFGNTAEDLSRRILEAEERLSGVRGSLADIDDRLQRKVTDLQGGVSSLGEQASSVCLSLTRHADTVTSVSSSVTQALKALADDLEKMGESGARNAGRFSELSESVRDNLGRIEQAAGDAEARERALAAALSLAQTSFGDLGGEVESVRHAVSALTEHATARLGALSSLFVDQVQDGEGRITQAVARLDKTGAHLQAQTALLEGAAEGAERRLEQAASTLHARHGAFMDTTDQAVSRLGHLSERMEGAVSQADQAHQQLVAQSQQNERLVSGLSDLAAVTTATLEGTTQRLAMLAQQAASDSSRMMDVAARIEQQQSAIRHAAEAAVGVMQSVEAQLHKSGAAGVSLMDAAEGRISDAMVAMTERLSSLSRQNEGLMDQLHGLVEGFAATTRTIQDSGRAVGADIGAVSETLQARVDDLTAAGLRFDRNLQERLASVEVSRVGLEGYFSGFGNQLMELDTRTSGYLADLERRADEGFGRLRAGVEQVAALPALVTDVQGMLARQVETARAEIAALRQDLVSLGRDMHEQVTDATGRSGLLLANIRDVGTQSRVTAEQLESVSQQIASASQQAWEMIRNAASEGMDGLSGLLNLLGNAHGQAGVVTEAARTGIEELLGRVDALTHLVDTSLGRLASRYQDVVREGFSSFERLSAELDSGATRLEGSTALAREHFGSAVTLLSNHQEAIILTGSRLAEQMTSVRTQLDQLREGFGGLETRMEKVTPVLASQKNRLDDFLTAVDRALSQASSLQVQARDLAQAHLTLADRVQAQEAALTSATGTLESRVGTLEAGLVSPLLDRLHQAAEQARSVDDHLDRLSMQAGKLDSAFLAVHQSLAEDVKALEGAEAGVSGAAERAALKLLDVGGALNATLGQLQKGGQLSHAGMLQANEETQRLVVRLEQVRALVKSMMSTVSTDLSDWQFDLKKRLATLSTDIGEQLAKVPKIPLPVVTKAVAPLLPAASSPGVVAASASVISAPPAGVASTQLTGEALDALAVDLYRVLHAESAELRKEIMPPLSRRQPMTPEDARAYTRTLLEIRHDLLCASVRDLCARSSDFRQYVERYLARFEAQYDALARAPDGMAAAAAWRLGESGRLYAVMAEALERKGRSVSGSAAATPAPSVKAASA